MKQEPTESAHRALVGIPVLQGREDVNDPWEQLAEHARLLAELAKAPEKQAAADRGATLDALAKLAKAIQVEAKHCRRHTIVELINSRMSQSAIARHLGVSQQRVNQLLADPD